MAAGFEAAFEATDIARLCWPALKLGEGVAALARHAGLINTPVENTPIEGAIGFSEDKGTVIERQAKRLGCEAEAVETTFADLENKLSAAHPAMLQLADAGFLSILDGGRRTLRVLTPDLLTRRIALQDVCDALRAAVEQPSRPEYQSLLSGTKLPPARQAKVLNLLLAEQIGGRRFDKCWILRVSPGASPGRWIRQAGALSNATGMIAAHSAQYLLWLASWVVLGRLSFAGRAANQVDRGWLLAWALLLITLVPLRVLTTWLQGLLVVGIGGILKRRLLWGALRLEPDEVRHQGVGSFLGQALEAEAVETLALSGGIAGLLAVIEIVVSGFVLGRFATLLFVWTALTVAFGWRFLRRYQRCTNARMTVTHDLIESMVGHRTRLAQQQPEQWHEAEDQALQEYFEASRAGDGAATSLMALIPRGWLLAGLACLAPAIVAGDISGARIAIVLGGVLLAYNAFKRLTASFAEVAGAWVAWQRIAPLFHAASRRELLPQVLNSQESRGSSETVIEADRLSYSYRRHGTPALQAGSLVIHRGDRILLEGSSGGGKSTFASLLAGLRMPDSGLLLLNGLDRHTLGDDHWRKQVVAAPQFHENHVLTETLAFNVLMGRGWPPSAHDLAEAEAMCRELGLGDLLERMPAGIMQMVGEGGWQLSHGERSRIYVARALLQKADLVILDESFAALDPENLKGALECTLRHAETLMVIAHP